MKINKIHSALCAVVLGILFTGCVSDDDTSLPNYKPVIFGEDFEKDAVDNQILVTPGWINFAEAGSYKWKTQYYNPSNYAEFSSFRATSQDPSELVTIGWLISPAVNMDAHEGEKLVFQSSMSYVQNAANTFEVLISSDFDGNEANILTSTWQPVDAILPTMANDYFEFVNSGEVDLSGYTGNIHIAFKVKGSSSNTQLDGSYQVDNIRIIY